MSEQATLGGRCDPRFERVREVFAAGFEEQRDDPVFGELGAAIAVVIDGREVIDLCAGYADLARSRPWREDTLANVYSTTKGFTALAVLRLVEECQLDLELPVARYWPEFAAAGKDRIPVSGLLDHTAGVAALRDPLPHEAIYDWESMTSALAAESVWWEPGRHHGYHAFTFGWLAGEIVRRVDGRTVGQFVRQELAGPVGADLHIGLAPADHSRVAELTPLPVGSQGSDAEALIAQFMREPDSVSARAFLNPPDLLAPTTVACKAWRCAEIPAANAHATARGIARIYGAVSGSRRSSAFLTGEGIDRCATERSQGPDEVLRLSTRFSLGFMLSQSHAPIGCGPRTFGHPGAGGSLGFADPDAQLGFGYIPNRLGPRVLVDPRAARLAETVYECL